MLEDMGVSDKFIRAVFEDSKGNYYIGCFLDGGLIKINPKTKEYKVYRNIEDDKTSISNNCIRYINEDLNGNILVGTSYGLNILDTNKDIFKSYTVVTYASFIIFNISIYFIFFSFWINFY